MDVIYALVARGTDVLVDRGEKDFESRRAALYILAKTDITRPSKCTYVVEGYQFDTLVSDGLTYLAVAAENASVAKVFAFLAQLQVRFCSTSLVSRVPSAYPYEFQTEFSLAMKDVMERQRDIVDHVETVREDAHLVQEYVKDACDKVVERGESLSVLKAKAESLNITSTYFRQNTGELRGRMWWRNMRAIVCLVLTLLSLVTAVTLVVLRVYGKI